MPYQTVYRMRFENVEQKTVTVNIYDAESWTNYEFAETMVHNLQPGGDPLHIVVEDNDEAKFSPIRSKRADIQFLSTNNYNAATFRGGKDNRWYVEVLNDVNLTLFRGYLNTGELEQPFLHNTTWQPVTLTAYDGLELLEDIPLTDFEEENPRGKHKIMQYIAWCLAKTNVQSDIIAVHNLREWHNPDDPMYESVYLDAKTFEDEIGTCVNCREVLEKILGNDAFITQYRGEWWIVRIDEMDWNATRVNRWDWEGNFLITTPNQDYHVNIGVQEAILFKGKGTTVRGDRAVDHTRLTFNYDYPKEIIDNIDFERGAPLTPVVIPQGAAYALDDWAGGRRLPTESTAINTPYIVRRVVDGMDEHFACIPKQSVTGQYYIKSNPVPVHRMDKFTFGVDFRFSDNYSNDPVRFLVAMIRLYGEDGTYWVLEGKTDVQPVSRWVPATGSWTANYYVQYVNGNIDTDDKQWKSCSVEVPPLPADGTLEILLLHDYQETACDVHFQNLKFEYIPYIKGNYSKYKAQYHQVEQEEDGYKKVYEEDVYVSDSPKKLFKGAMYYHRLVNAGPFFFHIYKPATTFYNAAAVSTPDETHYHPYGYTQAFAAWNQQRREITCFDAALFGIQSGEEPDLIHKYFFTDPHPATNNKYFMLLRFDMDLKRCEWTGYFMETFDTVLENSYDDPHLFKYITDK